MTAETIFLSFQTIFYNLYVSFISNIFSILFFIRFCGRCLRYGVRCLLYSCSLLRVSTRLFQRSVARCWHDGHGPGVLCVRPSTLCHASLRCLRQKHSWRQQLYVDVFTRGLRLASSEIITYFLVLQDIITNIFVNR